MKILRLTLRRLYNQLEILYYHLNPGTQDGFSGWIRFNNKLIEIKNGKVNNLEYFSLRKDGLLLLSVNKYFIECATFGGIKYYYHEPLTDEDRMELL